MSRQSLVSWQISDLLGQAVSWKRSYSELNTCLGQLASFLSFQAGAKCHTGKRKMVPPMWFQALDLTFSMSTNLVDLLTSSAMLIHSLFWSCCPANIADFIVPVVVDAIKCQSFRARSKFSKELLERCEQELDATAAVIFEAFHIRIVAALLCCCVNVVFRCGSNALFSHSLILSFTADIDHVNSAVLRLGQTAAADVVWHS